MGSSVRINILGGLVRHAHAHARGRDRRFHLTTLLSVLLFSLPLFSPPLSLSLSLSLLSSFSFSSLSVLRAFLLTSESERREAKGIARARYDKEICTSPTLSRCRARIIMCLLRSSFQRYGVYRYEAAVLSHLELVEQLFVSTLVIRCIFPSFERASSRSHRTESSRYG
jgi:hypothetical protein